MDFQYKESNETIDKGIEKRRLISTAFSESKHVKQNEILIELGSEVANAMPNRVGQSLTTDLRKNRSKTRVIGFDCGAPQACC